MRTCLKCNKLFGSTGSGNRICPECCKINDTLYVKGRCKLVLVPVKRNTLLSQ